jgi:small subunit ribosomal protein S16
MSVTIRLRRMGAKSQPSYRLVVTDSRNARDGRFIETIGFYNPRRQPVEIRIDEAKAISWLQRGATVSDTARSLLRKQGVWSKFTQGGSPSQADDVGSSGTEEGATAPRRPAVPGASARARAEGLAEAGSENEGAASAESRAAGDAPAEIETRSGRKKTVKKEEGMPPVSGREGHSRP